MNVVLSVPLAHRFEYVLCACAHWKGTCMYILYKTATGEDLCLFRREKNVQKGSKQMKSIKQIRKLHGGELINQHYLN